MAQLLEERMNRSYSYLSTEHRLAPDTSLLKSYFVEAHIHSADRKICAKDLLQKAFSQSHNSIRDTLQIDADSEEGFAVVEAKTRKESLTVYVDHSNPRFWILHSMNTSNALDPVIMGAIQNSTALDSAWMPADLLEFAASLGDIRGLGLSYDRRAVPDIDFEGDNATVEMLKMQLWGRKAGAILRLLRSKADGFPHETTLSKVKIKYARDDNPGVFTLDDIRYDGKITARGTSFVQHIELISTIYRRYQDAVSGIEERFAIRRSRKEDVFLDGAPITFILPKPIPDIGRFCERVFSASRPFRLWGVPVSIGNSCMRIHAVDLHIGSTLCFEVCPGFIRLYLPVGSCGNSVLRFYTNMQHFYDAQISAVSDQEGDVFAF